MAITIQAKGICCDNQPIKKVVYDCGDSTAIWFVCNQHLQQPVWSKNIISMEDLDE